ncbi:MAG TPA: SDR family oxidoreductase [Candidatus Sulfotelmatobacter sp.]|nr:SDR family oxidoreductase [Candidatus Sulfotelmatobacter sp.]
MSDTRIQERAFELLNLQDRVAIVTGAGSGIGRGIALRLAELGAHVIGLDKNQESLQGTAAKMSGDFLAIACDVSDASSCKAAVLQTLSAFPTIHILCNNAGIIIRKNVVDLEESEWDAVLAVTLKSVYLLSREVIPHMARNGGGSIINTGSGWAMKGGPKAAAYCAAKGGVLNLTRAMAIDHGPQNIRVNCVCPGDIDTPMLAGECEQLGEDTARFMRDAANRPLGRVGTTSDVANAVLFLASDMSKWITGASLVVDGGGLA